MVVIAVVVDVIVVVVFVVVVVVFDIVVLIIPGVVALSSLARVHVAQSLHAHIFFFQIV